MAAGAAWRRVRAAVQDLSPAAILVCTRGRGAGFAGRVSDLHLGIAEQRGRAARPFSPEGFPICIGELQNSARGLYGFPAIDGPARGIKVASEQFEATTTPDAVCREVSSDEIRAMH